MVRSRAIRMHVALCVNWMRSRWPDSTNRLNCASDRIEIECTNVRWSTCAPPSHALLIFYSFFLHQHAETCSITIPSLFPIWIWKWVNTFVEYWIWLEVEIKSNPVFVWARAEVRQQKVINYCILWIKAQNSLRNMFALRGFAPWNKE